MVSTTTILLVIRRLLLCVSVCLRVQGHNIEVGKVGIAHGEAGTQFGYTVAIVKAPGWVDSDNPKHPKLLLAGAPNRSVIVDGDVIKGHGDLAKCGNPDAKDITCNWMDIRETSPWDGPNTTRLCGGLRIDMPCIFNWKIVDAIPGGVKPNTQKTAKLKNIKKKDNTACEEDSRMGASLAVNRKYESTMHISDRIPMVSVCAPGWKNIYPLNHNYMIGMCLKLRDDLSVLNCDTAYTNKYSYCWPFWPLNNAFISGRPFVAYAQAGMSAAFTFDGRSELLGAPGTNEWRGGYSTVQKHLTKILITGQSTTYYGYSIASGMFKVNNASVVAGNPGHIGKVEFLNENTAVAAVEYGESMTCQSMKIIPQADLDHKQVGTKFGAAVAAIDLNNDGYDELLVGAPLFTGDGPEEGRVYVYTAIKNKACGPIGVLSGGANNAALRAKSRFARFGTSIASAGDLDKDGFNDVAVGAPYEDDGTGAVYIYHGLGQCDCLMEDTFVQRIAGRDINPSIKAFGWSIYGDDDLDYNGYPDLAVGAYASDMAVVLRTRPLVRITVEMNIAPKPIPLNASSLDCSLDKEQLCTVVSVFINTRALYSKRDTDNLTVIWDMNLDIVYKEKEETSRVVFRDTLLSRRKERIELTEGTSQRRFASKQYVLDVVKYKGKPEPKDAWTILRLEGSVLDIVSTTGDAFDKLEPVIDKGSKLRVVAETNFDKKCPSLNVCESDLKLDVALFLTGAGAGQNQPSPIPNVTIISVDPSQELLQIEVDVRNILNSSYRANFTSYVEAETKNALRTSLGKVRSNCNIKDDAGDSSTIITCSADSKLDKYDNFKVRAYYDISQAKLVPERDLSRMRTSIKILVRAEQANNDVDMANNAYSHTLNVKLLYKVDILKDKAESDQVRYNADPQSTRMITLVHRYIITNRGPSFLPKTYVNITVPVKKGQLYIARVKVDVLPQYCRIRDLEAQIWTTSTTTTTAQPTTHKEDIDIPGKPRTAPGNQPHATSKSRTITCSEYVCTIIECQINELGKDERHKLDITIEVYESAIANEKNVREVRYATNAAVTDPYIWFGGKVVPWDKTPSAEKLTTLFVEPMKSDFNIWIIIGSVLGGVSLLVILVLILWKLGFFKRTKHTEVKKWRRDSPNKKRKSEKQVSASANTPQSYSEAEKSGDTYLSLGFKTQEAYRSEEMGAESEMPVSTSGTDAIVQ